MTEVWIVETVHGYGHDGTSIDSHWFPSRFLAHDYACNEYHLWETPFTIESNGSILMILRGYAGDYIAIYKLEPFKGES